MPIYGVGDVANAYREGRTFQSFFTRTASGVASTTGTWVDSGMANGSTGYDVKTGDPLSFTPRTLTSNRGGIWPGPAMESGKTRHIVYASAVVAANNVNPYNSLMFYDLLGYYPLIDGSIPDTQVMDNTQTLPRYTDGSGVMGVWINHLAPTTANGTGTMTFVNHAGVTQSASVRLTAAAAGVGVVCTASGVGSTAGGNIFQPLGTGSLGIRSLTDVSFSTAQPGGFLCFMLVRPLFTMVSGGTQLVSGGNQFATEMCFTCQKAGIYPEVKDGAAINFLSMHNGGGATLGSHHGSLTFAWG